MTITAPTRARSSTALRLAYAAGGALATGATVATAVYGDGRAVAAAVLLAIAPDIPLLFGFTGGLEKGRLHPRAVPAYNATHRLVGPAGVLAAALATMSPVVGAAGLAWLAHVLVDRACGYGLRTPDGWQR